MGLNLSSHQIAQELDLNKDDAQAMTTQLRSGIVVKKPTICLTGEVEFDEAYVIAGHKGQPEVVKKKGRKGRRRRVKTKSGRGTLAKEKPPILGMIQRQGEVVLKMLPNVKQVTIAPIIKDIVGAGTLIYTDEYSIYASLSEWGYEHKTVCHSAGKYARDEDGDGFCEVHVNTMEWFWSLLRSWLRPHRGILQEKLPLYLGFFEFVHNTRKRGKGLLSALLGCLLK
jgi:transposase-like protein